jgi:hypothetical protein
MAAQGNLDTAEFEVLSAAHSTLSLILLAVLIPQLAVAKSKNATVKTIAEPVKPAAAREGLFAELGNQPSVLQLLTPATPQRPSRNPRHSPKLPW